MKRTFKNFYLYYMNYFAYLLGKLEYKFSGNLKEFTSYLECLTDKYLCSQENDIKKFLIEELKISHKKINRFIKNTNDFSLTFKRKVIL